MSFVTVMGIALGLAMDATAVAIGTSVALGRVSARQVFRFSFHFGLFQAAMPVVGWFAGRGLEAYIRAWDHWVAFGLLALIGGKALYEALRVEAGEESTRDPTRGWTATSIDALAAGISFAVVDVTIWYPAAVIGVVTAALTLLGMLFGSRIGSRAGRRMRALGGLVLVGIGVKILVEHLGA